MSKFDSVEYANCPSLFHIPDNCWKETGPDECRHGRLLCHMRIMDCDIHLQAWLVRESAGGLQHFAVYDEDYDSLVQLLGSGGFDTVEIRGKQYVIAALPHCQ